MYLQGIKSEHEYQSKSVWLKSSVKGVVPDNRCSQKAYSQFMELFAWNEKKYKKIVADWDSNPQLFQKWFGKGTPESDLSVK